MSETDEWPSINLSYFMWLPAGKDEFGFDRYAEAPLSGTGYYRTLLERTISVHFEQQIDALRDKSTNKLGFMDLTSPRTMDAELGLRKIHFTFSYEPSHDALRGIVREGLINGTGMILSNGLYLWAFKIVHRPGVSQERLREVLERFLIEDFVERHIRHIFHFQWNSAGAQGSTNEYRGILTYYQLDLLFNGVLDPAGHPHLSLGERSSAQRNGAISGINGTRKGALKGEEEVALRSYAVRSLIKSLSLCAIGQNYFPLFDRRKDYSLRGSHEEKHPHINSDLDFGSERASGEELFHEREILLSRMSFAAMEHFLRVAISFGLVHYRTGLDHIRAELVSQGMEARKNRPSGELRRPSLESRVLTFADLEAHHTLLAGKIPVLTFLLDLVEGLAEVSHPLRKLELNGRPGSAEWNFAESTLREARTQFRRQINAIQTDVTAIEASLAAVRTEMMLLELTEARKLTEIAAESSHGNVANTRGTETATASVELKAGQLEQQIAVPLTVFALIIGGIEVYTGLLLFVTDKVFNDTPFLRGTFGWEHIGVLSLWGIGILAFVVALRSGFRFYRRAAKAEKDDAQPTEETPRPNRAETHVFDYSSLLKEIQGQSEPIMEGVSGSMINIEVPRGEKVRCINYSTFRETPSSGTERIKYSLESPESERGLSYVLHVEVDRRLSVTQSERLRDIRLVVRRPTAARDVEVVKASVHVIASCLQVLVFPGENQGEVRTYLRERLGLEWEASGAMNPTESHEGRP